LIDEGRWVEGAEYSLKSIRGIVAFEVNKLQSKGESKEVKLGNNFTKALDESGFSLHKGRGKNVWILNARKSTESVAVSEHAQSDSKSDSQPGTAVNGSYTVNGQEVSVSDSVSVPVQLDSESESVSEHAHSNNGGKSDYSDLNETEIADVEKLI